MVTPTTYVDWFCSKCGYEHERSNPSYSIPIDCPECKAERAVRSGYPRLPVNQASCDSTPKQYDWCGGPKQIQVYLQAATGERTGHAMDPDWVPDCDDDPIDVARAVLKICETKYLYCGSKNQIKQVLAAMEACQAVSNQNKKSNHLHELRKQIVCGICEYNSLLEEEV